MPAHCTHLSLTEDTELCHWAATSGSLLLVHKPHYRGIAIKKGSTFWVDTSTQKQGLASLRTSKSAVPVVTLELDLELEVYTTTQIRVETRLPVPLIMAINTSKPWAISLFSDSRMLLFPYVLLPVCLRARAPRHGLFFCKATHNLVHHSSIRY